MYNVTVSFVPHALPAVTPQQLRVSQRVGFRVFALVTGNDTDPEWVVANKNGDGSATHGMYWRVNGAAIFAKGSSMVPETTRVYCQRPRRVYKVHHPKERRRRGGPPPNPRLPTPHLEREVGEGSAASAGPSGARRKKGNKKIQKVKETRLRKRSRVSQ